MKQITVMSTEAETSLTLNKQMSRQARHDGTLPISSSPAFCLLHSAFKHER